MKNVNGKEIEVYSVTRKPAGYGHWQITVDLRYNEEYRKFTATTNNMPAFDEANDLEDYNERAEVYYEIISGQIKEEIIEWMEEVDESND